LKRANAYTRAFYFAALAAVIAILDAARAAPGAAVPRTFYGVTAVPASVLAVVVHVLLVVVLLLPLFHVLGLLPQVSTLVAHVLEQAVLLALGGTATRSLAAAAAEVGRSVLLLLPPYFAFAAAAMAADSARGSALAAVGAGLLTASAYCAASLEGISYRKGRVLWCVHQRCAGRTPCERLTGRHGRCAVLWTRRAHAKAAWAAGGWRGLVSAPDSTLVGRPTSNPFLTAQQARG